LWEGAGYQQPQYLGPPQRRRSRALPIMLSILIVAILAGAGALVLHLRNNGSPGTGPTTPVTASSPASPSSQSSSARGRNSPVAVVSAYYDAVNNHDYATAYGLNRPAQKIESYESFKHGFAGTKHVDLTITDVSGDLVSFDLIADQTDGTTKVYTGTYTVRNRKIWLANVRRTS
jgi:hypothetical protein